MKTSKSQILIVLIATVLSLIMLFGAISGSSSAVLSGASNSLNNSSGSGNNNSNSNNQNSGGNTGTIIPDEPRIPFGGTNFLSLDFEDIDYSNPGDSILFEDNINSSNATYVSTYIEGGKFKAEFDYDYTNTTPDNSHFGFGIASNYDGAAYSLSDKDYFSIDIDYTIDNFTNNFSLYLMSRKALGEYTVSGNRIYGILDSNGNLNFSTKINTDTFICEDSTFHLTAVFEVNHNSLSSSRVLFYINGEYFTSFTYITDEALEFTTFRFHAAEEVWTSQAAIYADNVSFNYFGDGSGTYSGALSELFNNPDIDLTTCTDSILYKE